MAPPSSLDLSPPYCPEVTDSLTPARFDEVGIIVIGPDSASSSVHPDSHFIMNEATIRGIDDRYRLAPLTEALILFWLHNANTLPCFYPTADQFLRDVAHGWGVEALRQWHETQQRVERSGIPREQKEAAYQPVIASLQSVCYAAGELVPAEVIREFGYACKLAGLLECEFDVECDFFLDP
ncbi:MAG: hypothetical protein HYS22_02265 [Deltaproteobacteria bacterium]|nr:hypothetical protein [Deltaproteobacteria bacterium]